MEHVLKALDEHIAHQDWLLKCARREIDELQTALDALRGKADGEGQEEGCDDGP